MTFFEKHADAAAVISTLLGAVVWMSSQFGSVHQDIDALRRDIADASKEIAVIKAVLITKNIMSPELAAKE